MKLVIDIPDNFNLENEINTVSSPVIRKTLKNGTPLPKGHGRLVDADRLDINMQQFYKGKLTEVEAEAFVEFMAFIDDEPTVVVADKEAKDADND